MSSPLYKDAQQNGIIKIRFEIEDFDENRYREDEFRKNVEKGDPKALTELGDRYFSEKKFEQAFEVYKRAGNKKRSRKLPNFVMEKFNCN
ncbi:hypothetical protein MSI_26710 [Treponema sp. JC4]|uniref:hypothetical protein n=1 Tax=Treponema sp. JC4 TaxID=1124982 RepID=UPI00025B0B41|nr:hypothetical protein [Treponema sp. JC4]EID83929.1 hypothetical protein MSI_26710 [Treponema sp. JC4]